ncbi:MAG TPA: alpha-glucan family phosphorylase [Desulfobacteria bacterium]|nr:alpha-glucan family phosphorylase [Desulfobacteria bacterium]
MERLDSSLIEKYFHIALFSMEIGMHPKIPTYSGGLGVLAGDILRSCADLNVPLVAVTLASNKGYLSQYLDDEGNQTEGSICWRIQDFATLMSPKVSVPIAGRAVKVQAWKYLITGLEGHQVPVYLLDTDLFENSESDREITSYLYGGDLSYRLSQEIVLGIGGVRMLVALGHTDIRKYHLNEGHSALVVVELAKEIRKNSPNLSAGQIDELVRQKCVFTTHTPIPAGHDRFSAPLVKSLLAGYCDDAEIDNICYKDELNMTLLALEHSGHINGVAKRHEEISRNMFPGYPIDSITNGVHHVFWTSKPFRRLYDKHTSGWRKDSFNLRYVMSIPLEEIMQAHREAKRMLIDLVNTKHTIGMDYDTCTLGFARRMTRYKRPHLLFNDLDRLVSSTKNRSIQVIIAGKAHPKDTLGKELIKSIFAAMKRLETDIKIVFLENYDMELAQLITSGVDVWLNTPKIPCEASGTSGMKACLNGVPSLSVLDGWWVEGCVEGVTGWAIETKVVNVCELEMDDSEEAENLYRKLEQVVLPMFYTDREKWAQIMRYAIAFNGSFFNSHRMVQQYLFNAYLT